MVAAVANPKNPNILNPNRSRPPLTPSERVNADTSRRSRAKDIPIPSRYLSTSNSSSFTTTTSTSSSLSGKSSSSTRQFSSPFLTSRPSMQNSSSSSSTAVLLEQKRSNSVGRNRPAAASQRDPPRLSTGNSLPTVDPPPEISLSSSPSSSSSSAAARALCTMTRSLSVSFQGESFFYQTSKAKEVAPSPARKHTVRMEVDMQTKKQQVIEREDVVKLIEEEAVRVEGRRDPNEGEEAKLFGMKEESNDGNEERWGCISLGEEKADRRMVCQNSWRADEASQKLHEC